MPKLPQYGLRNGALQMKFRCYVVGVVDGSVVLVDGSVVVVVGCVVVVVVGCVVVVVGPVVLVVVDCVVVVFVGCVVVVVPRPRVVEVVDAPDAFGACVCPLGAGSYSFTTGAFPTRAANNSGSFPSIPRVQIPTPRAPKLLAT